MSHISTDQITLVQGFLKGSRRSIVRANLHSSESLEGGWQQVGIGTMCCCTSNFLVIEQRNKANVGFVCKLIGSVDESLCMTDDLVLKSMWINSRYTVCFKYLNRAE